MPALRPAASLPACPARPSALLASRPTRRRRRGSPGALYRCLQRRESGCSTGRKPWRCWLTLGLGSPRDPEAVCRLELGPSLSGAAALALREKVAEWLRSAHRSCPEAAPVPAPLRLGADPEFVVVEKATGQVLPASRFLPRPGAVGCDGYTSAPGVYPVAELRPAPSSDPRRLVEHLRRCLQQAAAWLPGEEARWQAGSEPAPGLPTGGHIHFSGIPLSGSLLRALDTYLAVPLFLLEPPGSAARRRARHGFLGDVRPKRHGGFEYRTPSSWLVSPEVALGALCLARVVAGGFSHLPRDPFLDARLCGRPAGTAARAAAGAAARSGTRAGLLPVRAGDRVVAGPGPGGGDLGRGGRPAGSVGHRRPHRYAGCRRGSPLGYKSCLISEGPGGEARAAGDGGLPRSPPRSIRPAPVPLPYS